MYKLIDNVLVDKRLLSLKIDCSVASCNSACCFGEGLGSPLTPDDINRISAVETLDFIDLSFGPRLKTESHTIKGACVFFNGRRCSIYNIRPIFCTLFPIVIEQGIPFKKMLFKPYDHCVFKKSETLLIKKYKSCIEKELGLVFSDHLFRLVR
jgi:hypothetical protein